MKVKLFWRNLLWFGLFCFGFISHRLYDLGIPIKILTRSLQDTGWLLALVVSQKCDMVSHAIQGGGGGGARICKNVLDSSPCF